MNGSFLVLCEGASRPNHITDNAGKEIRISAHGVDPNIRLESLDTRLYDMLDPLEQDLVHVAAYVYSADRMTSRGRKDVFGERWKRRFHFVVPVQCRSTWESPEVTKLLTDALRFLSEDIYTFTFVDLLAPHGHHQTYVPGVVDYSGVTSVALFSGGLDSLAGVVWDHVVNGQKSFLVSHRPAPVISSRQEKLVQILRERFPSWNPGHATVWVQLEEGLEKEHTQRTRSFLYLSLAAAAARRLGQRHIKVYENGIVSLNLPILGQTVGARLTRTTHPRFIGLAQEFFRAVLEHDILLETPFLFLTKGEVAHKLAEAGHPDLIAVSTSCSHTYLYTRAIPHCGICSQCVDRRLAIVAMNLEEYDDLYQHEMFRGSFASMPEKAQPKAMVEGYVRAYLEVGKLAPERLYEKYPEIGAAIVALGRNHAQTYAAVFDLFQRRAAEVESAIVKEMANSASDLVRGNLPSDCLLRVVGSGEHLIEPTCRLAEELVKVVEAGLPLTFRSKLPANETEVQNAAEALFLAADEKLTRELPMVDFLHVKGAKPDFSAARAESLFVEIKYVRKTRPPGAIADEIAADMTIYRRHSRNVLFIVYDPHRLIANVHRFVDGFEPDRGVFGAVVR